MAKVYDEWINRITKLRQEMREYERVSAVMRRQKTVEEDQILGELEFIRSRISTSSKILTDRGRAAFFFVVVPEQMIIRDTQQAAELFARFDVPIAGYVMNRIVPEELLDQAIPDYLRNRIGMQRRYRAEIERTFAGQVLASVPELERDVTGLAAIERLASIMYGG
jgi:arsenite-transporting ATPase